jgi:hypothetical protein
MYRFGVCTTSAALAVGEAVAELMRDKDVGIQEEDELAPVL